jgi:hypothetical protein
MEYLILVFDLNQIFGLVQNLIFVASLLTRFRYIILLISLLGLTSISSNMFTVNIALICMAPSANTTVNLLFLDLLMQTFLENQRQLRDL